MGSYYPRNSRSKIIWRIFGATVWPYSVPIAFITMLISSGRFFLGFTEAAISPAFSLITAMWYKRDEQPLRIAIWYSSTGFGGLVGSLVAYSIGHIKGPLAPWKYQYLIIGSITVIWGFLIFFLLPNNPLAAWFLNQNHRILAVHRMKAEQTGLENKRFKW